MYGFDLLQLILSKADLLILYKWLTVTQSTNQTSRLDLVFLFEEQWVLTDAGDNRITSIFDVPSSQDFYWFLQASSSQASRDNLFGDHVTQKW